jgi:hypothetical protein
MTTLSVLSDCVTVAEHCNVLAVKDVRKQCFAFHLLFLFIIIE